MRKHVSAVRSKCYVVPHHIYRMSDTERPRERWMRPGDRPILRFLAAEGPEYPAIVANRTGMHAPRVEERCEALAERGLA
jgi:hypothetical protein